MKIEQIILPKSEVKRVISLSEGDVYRRVVQDYSSSKPRLVYGTVTGILANGEQVAVSALEFSVDEYRSTKVASVTFRNEDDVDIFPGEQSEFDHIVGEMLTHVQDEVSSARRSLAAVERKLAQVEQLQAKRLIVDVVRNDFPDKPMPVLERDAEEDES